MIKEKEKPLIYGLMAEFDTAEDVVHAAQEAYKKGYRKMDGFSPFPIEALSEAVGFHRSKLPWLVLCGALTGSALGYGLQYFTSVIDYPLNIGGRPLNSWVSFIPITFETTILLAAFTAVVGMFLLNGLPMHYHPVFNVPRFSLASQDKFFLCIEATDEKFDQKATADFLKSLHAREVTEVAH